MSWHEDNPMAQTLLMDQIGMTCVTHSPISKVSGTVEYNFQSGLRRLTVDSGDLSLSYGWTTFSILWPVLELEAMTHTGLEQWQERHIKRALQGYKPWAPPRLMRALLAEMVAAQSKSTPWKRLFS